MREMDINFSHASLEMLESSQGVYREGYVPNLSDEAASKHNSLLAPHLRPTGARGILQTINTNEPFRRGFHDDICRSS